VKTPAVSTPESALRAYFEDLPAEMLEQALTHSSWIEDRARSYERLEFLGDSVLGLAVAWALHERFPGAEEGTLAKLKAFVVSRRSCGVVARRLALDDLVLERAAGTDEQRRELAGSATSLGNVLEALIGATYLARGFDTVRDAVVEAFADRIAYGVSSYVDYKSTLQEHLASSGLVAEYRLVETDGPPHARAFTSEVLVTGSAAGRGSGRSIKKSEQRAAHAALVGMGVLAAPSGRGSPHDGDASATVSEPLAPAPDIGSPGASS
jgi:ribonuclease-3